MHNDTGKCLHLARTEWSLTHLAICGGIYLSSWQKLSFSWLTVLKAYLLSCFLHILAMALYPAVPEACSEACPGAEMVVLLALELSPEMCEVQEGRCACQVGYPTAPYSQINLYP